MSKNKAQPISRRSLAAPGHQMAHASTRMPIGSEARRLVFVSRRSRTLLSTSRSTHTSDARRLVALVGNGESVAGVSTSTHHERNCRPVDLRRIYVLRHSDDESFKHVHVYIYLYIYIYVQSSMLCSPAMLIHLPTCRLCLC